MELSVTLDIATTRWKGAFPKMQDKIRQAAAAAFLNGKKPAAFKNRRFEISITLATDKKIRTLNRDYRGMDKPTNVLSFPQLDIALSAAAPRPRLDRSALAGRPPDMPVPLGDVVLAYETVKRECRAEKKTLENHTVHLVVHGVLHLLGYDHMNAKDAKFMEKLECDILDALGYPDPYHDLSDIN